MKAQGWQPVRQFAHKAKVRKAATYITKLQAEQGLEMSAWDSLANAKRSVDRQRANWRGFIVYSAMVYDGRPRLRRANGN